MSFSLSSAVMRIQYVFNELLNPPIVIKEAAFCVFSILLKKQGSLKYEKVRCEQEVISHTQYQTHPL